MDFFIIENHLSLLTEAKLNQFNQKLSKTDKNSRIL